MTEKKVPVEKKYFTLRPSLQYRMDGFCIILILLINQRLDFRNELAAMNCGENP
jgi:hypothetical protein